MVPHDLDRVECILVSIHSQRLKNNAIVRHSFRERLIGHHSGLYKFVMGGSSCEDEILPVPIFEKLDSRPDPFAHSRARLTILVRRGAENDNRVATLQAPSVGRKVDNQCRQHVQHTKGQNRAEHKNHCDPHEQPHYYLLQFQSPDDYVICHFLDDIFAYDFKPGSAGGDFELSNFMTEDFDARQME